MPGKILGIDISEHNISAVQVISGLKGYQLLSCFSAPITDDNLEKSIEEWSKRFDIKCDKCILTIPPSNISFRNVNTPFKDAKKVRQTLPFEIETHVPFAVDKMVIDYNHISKNDPSSILTAAIDKEYIAGYIEKFGNFGVEPDIIDIRPVPAVNWLLEQEMTPDTGIYIDLEYKQSCIIVFRDKKIVLIRKLPCSFPEVADDTGSEEAIHPSPESLEIFFDSIFRETRLTAHSFISQARDGFNFEKVFYGGSLSPYQDIPSILSTFFEAPSERINISRDTRLRMDRGISGVYEPALMDNALAASIGEGKKTSGFNLRRDEFTAKRKIFGPGKDMRITALLVILFFTFMLINNGMDYYYLNKKHAKAETHFIKEFDRKFPENKGQNIKLKRLILRQKLQEAKNPSTDQSDDLKRDQRVLDILKDIFERIPENYPIDIKRMTITNRDVTIKGITDGYDTVDKIANILKPSSLFKNVEAANLKQEKDGNGFEFDLKIERAE